MRYLGGSFFFLRGVSGRMGSGFFLVACRGDGLREAVFFFAGPIPFLLAPSHS